MAAALLNVGVTGIGTAWVPAYTVPERQTSMLLGCSMTNVFGAIVPADVVVRKGAMNVHLAKARRVAVGQSAEMVSGKVVLAAGDTLLLRAHADAAFDALVSLAQGV